MRLPRRQELTRHAPAALLTLTVLAVGGAAAGQTGGRLTCDLSGYTYDPGVAASFSTDLVAVEWDGAQDERLRLRLGVVDRRPVIVELSIRGPDDWVVVVSDARFEFAIVEGFRRISNQQLAPLRALGVELTDDVVDRYKWDVFWDAPLDLRAEVPGNNPPPAAGVAHQPGLPRSPGEIRRATAEYDTTTCRVTRDGRQVAVAFPGMRLGSFSGELVLTMHQGTNLIRVEAVASTTLPSVAQV